MAPRMTYLPFERRPLIAAVVAIFVAATEALAEVIVVVVPLYVVAAVAVVGVAIGVRVLRIAAIVVVTRVSQT
ncbi:MAG: hypothetical protein AABN34_13145 [Acidobacteriota bacterium]